MPISKVNGNEPPREATPVANRRIKAAYAAATAPSPPRQADSVTLSDAARALAAANKAVASAPDVREDRIQALKAAIADGTYSVDSRKLARAMIEQSDSLT
jgi:negative regulator of flagellin synthesis FlgM